MSATSAKPPLLEVQGISKSFPGVRALKGVNLEVRSGEVQAVLGVTALPGSSELS
jgi:ribose transport system ATP-binding protein